jgi:hypothetical protein
MRNAKLILHPDANNRSLCQHHEDIVFETNRFLGGYNATRVHAHTELIEEGDTDWEIRFSRTFDEDDCSPVRNDREFSEERGPLARSGSLDHQECVRTDK